MHDVLYKLPSLENKTKEELLEVLLAEEYGYLPPAPDKTDVTEESRDLTFCAGRADLVTLKFTCYGPWGEFSFPAYYVCPKQAEKPVPAFVHINFRNLIPDRYQPTEELVQAGYATLTFCHNDITRDNWDFTEGFAGLLYPDGVREKHQCGKNRIVGMGGTPFDGLRHDPGRVRQRKNLRGRSLPSGKNGAFGRRFRRAVLLRHF